MPSQKPAMTSRISSRAIVALVAATVGLATLTPAANAAGPGGWGDHRAPGAPQAHRFDDRNFGPDRGWRGERGPKIRFHRGDRMGGPARGRVAFGFQCGPNAAERMEHALVALKYRTNPTGDQVALFDTFQQAALDAQKSFASTCEATMPGRGDAAKRETRPNMLDALQARLKIDEARLTALKSVVPHFETYVNSLSDEQKSALEFRGHRPGRGNGPDAPKAGPGARNT